MKISEQQQKEHLINDHNYKNNYKLLYKCDVCRYKNEFDIILRNYNWYKEQDQTDDSTEVGLAYWKNEWKKLQAKYF